MMTPLVATGTRPGVGSRAAPGAPASVASPAPAAGAATTTRSGAAARVGSASARTIFHQADFPAVDVRAIQLVEGPLHVRVTPELNYPLIGALLVSVRIGHLSCLTHEVLQILPAAAAGQVLHYEAVLCTDWGPILISARAAPAAVSTTVAISVSPWSAGMFDYHPLSAQVLPVQLVNGVIGVSVVLELHETITVL